MPCRDGGPSEYEVRTNLQDDVDQLTRMLCSLCRKVEEYDEPEMPHNVRVWWNDHKEADERRRAFAKAEAADIRKQKKLEKSAIAKLSRAEIEALGIDVD